MRPKQRIRKIYTEPDMSQGLMQSDDNLIKTNNINIKDLQLNVNDVGKNVSDSKNNRNFMYKNTPFNMPTKFNKINRKQLIKKLPDINFTSLNTISRPLKLNPIQQKIDQKININSNINHNNNNNNKDSNKKNTFLLNSLFQILKPQDSIQRPQNRFKDRSLKFNQKTNISIDSFYQNQFINLNNASTKNNRGPKIIQNEITRLSNPNPNNIIRRKIVSQEKSRPKYRDKSIEKLKQTTFENFKRCLRLDEENEQNNKMSQNINININVTNGPKENFQNLQIITFYNKFPNFNQNNKKRYDQKQPKSQSLIQSKEHRQLLKPSTLQPLKKKIYTEMPQYYQEENEFIFQKK